MYKVWIDLDGVLANWHKAACKCFNVEYPKNHVFYRDWICSKVNEPIVTLLDRMDNTPRFWEDMEPFPMTGEIEALLDTEFPDWKIITKATVNSQSWAGKAAWVRRYFGEKGVHRLYVTAGPKAVLASPTSILIDDTEYQIKAWKAAGGLAFRWREYSIDRTDTYKLQFEDLKKFLLEYKPVKKSKKSS